MTGFIHRGVIEGYYGPPYSHADRLWFVEKLGSWGLNRFVYAPKDDPLHRAEWRDPYPAETLREFAELVERGARCGVDVGFAVSPGLTMKYSDTGDLAALTTKLRGFRELGSRFLSLALDDVPARLDHEADRRAFPSLGDAHVAVTNALEESLGSECCLWLVPTDYVGVDATDYLATLGNGLNPRIEVGWTGRTVVSPTILGSEAARRASTLRRPLLLWDNTPVSDGPMNAMLHLGPYVGREASLSQHVSGIFLNTMEHAHASAVTVRAAADYLNDPEGFDPERSWEAALEELGAGAPEAFRHFAEAHRFSALLPQDRDRELEEAFGRVRAALDAGPGAAKSVAELQGLLAARAQAAEALRSKLSDADLAREIEPWIRSHEHETKRMKRASALLEALCEDGEAFRVMALFFTLASADARRRPGPEVSYGPRRVVYPQLTSMRREEAGFGVDPPLFADLSLADELVSFAEARALARLRPEGNA